MRQLVHGVAKSRTRLSDWTELMVNFPDSPVVKTSLSNARGVGSIPGQGAKIPTWLVVKKTQNIKQKPYCNKFNKDFKNDPYKNNL